MSVAALIQLISACVGIIGALFFAIGIMRQSIEAMGRLSGAYWDWNPHMPPFLAAQKADYVFGGGLILIAFILQLTAFFAPSHGSVFRPDTVQWVPWIAAVATVLAFLALRVVASRVATRFQVQIEAWLRERTSRT